MDVWRTSAKLLLLLVIFGGVAGSKPKIDDSPALTELRNFPAKDSGRSIDVAAEIGTDYEHFGTLILEDQTGSRVKSIDKTKHGDTVDIAVEILRLWLQGKGRLPVTWRTLVECLQDIGLNVLANNIKRGLSPGGDNEVPDNIGPSVEPVPHPSDNPQQPDNPQPPASFEYTWIIIAGTAVGGGTIVLVFILKKSGGQPYTDPGPQAPGLSSQLQANPESSGVIRRGDRPTLRNLKKFPVKHGKPIDIPVRIGTNYRSFGIFLLEDDYGAIVSAIEGAKNFDSVKINEEILMQWIGGKGKEPFTWGTLITCLRDVELGTLASDIEEALK